MQDPPVTHVMATMKALIFTKMVDYQHSSTPAAAAWLLAAVTERGWKGVVSDDSSILEDGSVNRRLLDVLLAQITFFLSNQTLEFDIIILVNNSGAIFDPASQVLKKHLEAGRSVLGIHAALATFLDGQIVSPTRLKFNQSTLSYSLIMWP
mmetsp:Transcript_12209/g.24787  ORF Transcript_12209/g.24787 Transcript_12209/m.24787 type:complete len:151 (-) Transcript_12209:800-1252(-)